MKKKSDQSADTAELRRRAEERLGEKRKSQKLEAGNQSTADDTARLVHELQVHQIELEMQNEELRQAHAQVEMLLAQYTDLYDFAPTGYLTLDREGTIRLVNLTGARMLGVERSRLVKRRFGQFVAESDRHAFSDFLQKVFASEAKECCEVTLPREGLQPLVVQIEGTRSADGQECRAMVLDITARKQAEEALRETNEYLDDLFNYANAPIIVWDPLFKITRFNHAFESLTGRRAGDVIGKSLEFLFPPPLVESSMELIKKTLAGERWETVEIAIQHRDGPVRTLLWNSATLFAQDGKAPVATIAQGQDITERKRAEAALRQSEEQFRAIFEMASVGIAQADIHTGQWLRVNQKMCAITGYFADELLRLHISDITHPDDRQPDRAAFQRVVRGEQPDYRMEKRYVRKDGSLAWVNVNMTVIRDAAGQPTRTVAAIEDITVRKQAEAALEKAHQELIDASRQAGMAEFATGVLHNVGNVLNSVGVASTCVADSLRRSKSASLAKVVALLRDHQADLGNFFTSDPQGKQVLEFLAQLAGQLAAEQVAVLQELAGLQKNIAHIKDVVSTQQSMAKISGAVETLKITELVEDAVRMNASSLARQGIQVIRQFAEVPPFAIAKNKVLQILVNLVRNAEQAYANSDLKEKTLTLRVTRQQDCARVTISDNGVGIPPENLERIFTHGFTTKKDGHGFGLRNCVVAAGEMGGSLTVHSDGPGQGATFTLEIPCPQPEVAREQYACRQKPGAVSSK